ncbi:MAG: four helix bundle protein [Bacteroidota bacterium]
MYNNFEDLQVWRTAKELTVSIYKLDYQKDYNFKNQITRAAVSVLNNIAEGKARNSDKDFKNFLRYSYASCSEVKSMLYLAKDLNYIDSIQKRELMQHCSQVSSMLFHLMKKLN